MMQQATQPRAHSVLAVARYLRERLEADPALTDLWIEGEVSNYSLASSGHMYFTLKDQHAGLRCVFFRSNNLPHRRKMASGAHIIAHGRVSFYEQRGDVQFVVDFVEPAGTGALQAEFERRRQRFEAEGLFDPARKRPLPRFPRSIGVVTSPTGAAIHDILTVLERRWPMASITHAPARVQGEGAAVYVAAAIRSICSGLEGYPDVVIVGRGGGSAEDLWAFNEEPVVRAIFGCPVPVISAVGHETDVTLADLVADVRAATPSAAAELAAPDRADVARNVDLLLGNAEYALWRRVERAEEDVRRTVADMTRSLPQTTPLHRRIAQRAEAMRFAALNATSAAREQTIHLASRVEALSPHATLARGYALVSHADGRAAPTAASVADGDDLDVRWRDGSRRVRVQSQP